MEGFAAANPLPVPDVVPGTRTNVGVCRGKPLPGEMSRTVTPFCS
jgi:hypothetical protein